MKPFMGKCYNKLQIDNFFHNTVLGLSYIVTLAMYNCHIVDNTIPGLFFIVFHHC